jgi:hypothetical protein
MQCTILYYSFNTYSTLLKYVCKSSAEWSNIFIYFREVLKVSSLLVPAQKTQRLKANLPRVILLIYRHSGGKLDPKDACPPKRRRGK